MTLKDNPEFDGDAFHADLKAIYEGLDDIQSQALNARLIVMMANEIGDLPTLQHLLKAARSAGY